MEDAGAASPISSELLCQQCAAVLPVEQGSPLAVCQYCGTSNVVDKSEAVLHYVVRDTLRENDATAATRRWMGGNATVKNLDKKAHLEAPLFQLWPLWLIRAEKEGAEKIFLEPAAPLAVLDVTRMTIPAADLEPYDYALDEAALTPSVPLTAVKKWLAEDHGIGSGAVKEISLVHLPVFVLQYRFGDRTYTAVVDAASSKVYADLYPSKQEVPYRTLGSVGCALFFFASLVPAVAFMAGGGFGLLTGLLIYLVVAAVLSVPLFVAASVISARV